MSTTTSPEKGQKKGLRAMNTPPIVSPQEWEAAREQLLVKEKELTRARDALAAERRRMPWPRRVAGKVLSFATRWASGLSVDDCQCGFTGLGRRGASLLPLDEVWPGFGYPNDLLMLAAHHGLRVMDVTVRPIYADEQSGVRPWHALRILRLLARRAFKAPPPLLANARHERAGRSI